MCICMKQTTHYYSNVYQIMGTLCNCRSGRDFHETYLPPSRAQHTALGSLFCEIKTPTERLILDDSIVKHDVAVEDGQIDTGRKSLPFERRPTTLV